MRNFAKPFAQNAFTLAEVLITLGIIGIVAALTIPTILSNTQDQSLKSGLKAGYSIISQAFSAVINENSGSAKNLCSSGDHVCFLDAFDKQLSFIKKCGIAENGCWDPNKIKYLYNFEGTSYTVGNKTTAILKNGMTLALEYGDETCESDWYSQAIDFKVCGTLQIDVNGLKKPNTKGRDMFIFWVTKDRLLPFGSQGDKYDGRTIDYCDPSKSFSVNGYSCAAKYLQNQ